MSAQHSGTFTRHLANYSELDACLPQSAPVEVDSDEALIARMRRGDELAFAELYQRRQPDIYRFVRHMSGSVAVAEEVTQEVFLAMIRQLDRFDPRRGTVIGYLYAIARRLSMRALRVERRHVRLEAPELIPSHDHEGAMEAVARADATEAIRRWMLTLPLHYREALVLCDIEELDYAAAARVLECPIGTVRSRLHRARALLVKRLRATGFVRTS